MYFVMFIINNNNELPTTTSMSCRNNVVNFVKVHHENRVYPFTGLDYWTGILDWTTGLKYFPFLDKCLCLFLERSLHVATSFYNHQVPDYYG